MKEEDFLLQSYRAMNFNLYFIKSYLKVFVLYLENRLQANQNRKKKHYYNFKSESFFFQIYDCLTVFLLFCPAKSKIVEEIDFEA